MSEPKRAAIKILQYKTNVGFFIKRADQYHYNTLRGFIINGQKLNESYKDGWFKLDSEVTKVEMKSPERKSLVGYSLLRKEIESDTIPLFIPKEFVQWDDMDCCRFIDPYVGLDSLYEESFELIPEDTIEIDFEIIDKGTYIIDNQFDLINRVIRVSEDKYKPSVDVSSIVSYDEFASLITPEFAKHTAPCMLTSEQVYKITRQFIKENFDRKISVIASDYDFCFSVKKIIPLSRPYNVNVSGNRNIKKVQLIDTKQIEIFEMTYSGYRGSSGYEKYTCAPEIKGENLQSLHDNLTKYLQEIIQVINEPIEECASCNGLGHHFRKWSSK